MWKVEAFTKPKMLAALEESAYQKFAEFLNRNSADVDHDSFRILSDNDNELVVLYYDRSES